MGFKSNPEDDPTDSLPCVELVRKASVDRGGIYVTRDRMDRMVCKLYGNEAPLLFDFTGINHYYERSKSTPKKKYS